MKSLGIFLYESLLKFGNYPAIKIKDKTINYDELNNKALKIAGFLSDNGILNKNVGIITQRSFSAYAGILGTIYAGCVYVPINTKYPKERIAEIVELAEIEVLIGDEFDWHDVFPKIQPLKGVTHVLFPEDREVFLEKPIIGVSERQLESTSLTKPILTGNNANAYTIFTSGSTGKPKGIGISNNNLYSLLMNMSGFFNLEPGFNASQTFDLSFDLSVSDMFFTWVNGGTLCVLPEDELNCPADYINREKIEFWHSVPTLAEFLFKLGFLKPKMYPSLRYSIFCGEPLTQRVADAWMAASPNSTVENFYGPTEATVFVSRYVYKKEDSAKTFYNGIVPIGKPFPNHRMILVDEDNNVVNKKETGEIAICGTQVSNGYLKDPEKTKSVFVNMTWDRSNSIWYKSGDLAKYNKFGDMEYIIRKDNQIKIAGRRIEIGEIESVLRGNFKGTDPIVVPIRNDFGIVESLVAFVTVRLTDNDMQELRNNCEGRIERLFFPKKFLFIKKIPTTTSGKIDRVLLEKKAIENV